MAHPAVSRGLRLRNVAPGNLQSIPEDAVALPGRCLGLAVVSVYQGEGEAPAMGLLQRPLQRPAARLGAVDPHHHTAGEDLVGHGGAQLRARASPCSSSTATFSPH
jgi:hypothetical protein